MMMKIRLRQNEDNYDKTDNKKYNVQMREDKLKTDIKENNGNNKDNKDKKE